MTVKIMPYATHLSSVHQLHEMKLTITEQGLRRSYICRHPENTLATDYACDKDYFEDEDTEEFFASYSGTHGDFELKSDMILSVARGYREDEDIVWRFATEDEISRALPAAIDPYAPR